MVIAILDNIRSAYNVGSMFRTADCAGIDKLYLCGITATPDSPKLEKTALGALDFVEWEYAKDTLKLIQKLKKEGIKIFAVEIDQRAQVCFNTNYKGNIALIFGNEITGISKDILDISNQIIQIPMFGKKNSLNVATSFGIVSYCAINRNK